MSHTRNRITAVAVRDVSQFDQSSKGMWTCRISFIEWKAPQDAIGRPNGTIPGAEPRIPPFTQDPQIAALLDKVDGLGGVSFR